jgi:hypothetical protein
LEKIIKIGKAGGKESKRKRSFCEIGEREINNKEKSYSFSPAPAL